MTTSPRRATPATRATRRSRRPSQRNATFVDRNRSRLIWTAAIVGVLLAGGFVFWSSSQPAYACSNEFNPTPAPVFTQTPTLAPSQSPFPGPTAAGPGYVQPDMGHTHQRPIGSFVKYTWCPPASGRHYEAPGGPIPGGLYGPDEKTIPQGWIHNLEHGAIVLLYKCPGPGCEDAGQAQLDELLDRWPDSPICHTPPGNLTPVITRFDDMPYPYAALVWDVVLPMQVIDENLLFQFYARQAEQFNPEKLCAMPTPTPAPATPTPPVTAPPSPAPSAAPSSASPAPAASGSAAPAARTAPASS